MLGVLLGAKDTMVNKLDKALTWQNSILLQ